MEGYRRKGAPFYMSVCCSQLLADWSDLLCLDFATFRNLRIFCESEKMSHFKKRLSFRVGFLPDRRLYDYIEFSTFLISEKDSLRLILRNFFRKANSVLSVSEIDINFLHSQTIIEL